MKSPNQYYTRPRGSALVIVMMLTAVLLITCSGLLSWMLSEQTLNKRQALRLEARNAVEALTEYGMYQVRAKMQMTAGTTDINLFTPGGHSPLTLPDSSVFAGGTPVASMSLFCGQMITVKSNGSTLYYVDSKYPNNQYDPLKDHYVYRRDFPIYAKVVLQPPGATAITTYLMEKISVRGAPLFAHAIFYNMDLELHPGPQMSITGPVHTNGNLFIDANQNTTDETATGSTLDFKGVVTVSGNIFHAWKSNQYTAHGNNEVLNMKAAVNFTADATGTLKSLLEDGTTPVDPNKPSGAKIPAGWKDSTMNGTTMKGTNSDGTTIVTLDQSTKIVHDDEPSPPGTGSTTYTLHSNTADVNQKKYSDALNNSATQQIDNFMTYENSRWNGYLQTIVNGVQNYTPVAIGTYSSQTSVNSDDSNNSARAIIEPPVPTTDTVNYNADIEAQKFSTKAGIYIKVTPGTRSVNATTGAVTAVSQPTVVVYGGGPPGAAGVVAITPPAGLLVPKTYSDTATGTKSPYTYAVNTGMYDQRRSAGVDTVDLDMAVLKAAIVPTEAAKSGTLASLWNGIVYVEVVGAPSTQLGNDPVVTAKKTGTTNAATNAEAPLTAVRVLGQSVQFTNNTVGPNPGITIATNAPLYVKGSFNSDGNPSASAATAIDTNEQPACLAADAITVLSKDFSEANSRNNAVGAAPSGKIEIAAAFLTGIVPTDKNGNAQSSGGAHNFPRFLENWSGINTYIRGSMVCLFESRVATEPWSTDYYGAPLRNWGFSDQFKSGVYPPGTPQAMSYRRVDFAELKAADYQAALTAATPP